ncbi:cbb3-type cytochrome c oxidase subunit 3 [Pseudomonas sp. PDM14]|uniref:cbb3-type cytochrome c oxidase subunit 3 n=1 Tax=Pseudomonas sp. PDM14 TaxID=2769288 RepID=UPI0017827399|nr:cbb3-type cytochrome c oxidase subunit 3 [Pseudomonas sp. PDM14]MBD9481770.1 cbb3-type cytochrome c oxidase subunit 3 [Pseudomonas sp. PDM14]
MPGDLWFFLCAALFFCAVQLCLAGKSRRHLDEATMQPFADDPDVARRMERATARSRTGCSCPGTCDGSCAYREDLSA